MKANFMKAKLPLAPLLIATLSAVLSSGVKSRILVLPLLISLAIGLSSCGQLISNAKREFSADLAATILASDDPETIKKGVPSYLLLLSSLIRGEPENPELLESGAQLYSAYGSSFTDTLASKKALTKRAYAYASRAICLRNEQFCHVDKLSFAEYETLLASIDKSQAENLFIFSSSWASVIEANSGDWDAVAELPKVKAGMKRVLALDETVSNGNAHVYMAVLESLLPPSLGGKPELAKQHFERADELSEGKNLMAKVLYAEKYARLLFDRELHDVLLKQVLDTDIGVRDYIAKNQYAVNDEKHDRKRDEELILINTLAKQKAAELLDSADDYF